MSFPHGKSSLTPFSSCYGLPLCPETRITRSCPSCEILGVKAFQAEGIATTNEKKWDQAKIMKYSGEQDRIRG